jgi:hypothetical protein
MKNELGSYEMDGVKLDLGYDMNILSIFFCELMGKPNLVWSPIQLSLANQYKVYPIGKLEQVEVNIDGVRTKGNFELIKIMDELDPYPTLLGIDWEFDNNAIPNLKQQHMSFEIDTLRIIAQLDPKEGDKYNNLVNEDAQISIIENI